MKFRAVRGQQSPVKWMEVRRVLASGAQAPQLGGGVASLAWPVGPLGTEPAGKGVGAACLNELVASGEGGRKSR